MQRERKHQRSQEGEDRSRVSPGWVASKGRRVCPVGRTIHAEVPGEKGVGAEVREGCLPGPTRGREVDPL